jgi:hypothetical protein
VGFPEGLPTPGIDVVDRVVLRYGDDVRVDDERLTVDVTV